MVWVNVEPESYYLFTYRIAFAVNDVGMVLFFALMTKEVVEATVTGGVLHPWRRALAPVQALRRAGVNVAYASNNVRNAFTPFGNADLLESGLLLMAAGHLASRSDVEAVFEMATTNAARAIGLCHHSDDRVFRD